MDAGPIWLPAVLSTPPIEALGSSLRCWPPGADPSNMAGWSLESTDYLLPALNCISSLGPMGSSGPLGDTHEEAGTPPEACSSTHHYPPKQLCFTGVPAHSPGIPSGGRALDLSSLFQFPSVSPSVPEGLRRTAAYICLSAHLLTLPPIAPSGNLLYSLSPLRPWLMLTLKSALPRPDS